MRIIGGDFRGRALASVGKGDPAAHLRPTTDRVRESLFNILSGGRYGDPVTGAVTLDVFAGTGALGLEALSRGASHVTFFENGRKSLSLLRENIALCRVADRSAVVTRDATRAGSALKAAADLVFLDPPYGSDLGSKALNSLIEARWIAPGALIVWEDNDQIAAPDGTELVETRKMGGTSITFLRLL